MRENEFEKRVHQKMEELNLHPSPEVWEEVERRIRKEKKRRFIFWWPLLFLTLGGGVAAGIWMTNKKEPAATSSTGKSNTKNTQIPAENTTTSIYKAPEKIQPGSDEQTISLNNKPTNKTNEVVKQNTARPENRQVNPAGIIKKDAIQKQNPAPKKKNQKTDNLFVVQQADKDKEIKVSDVNIPVIQQKVQPALPGEDKTAPGIRNSASVVTADTILNNDIPVSDSVSKEAEKQESTTQETKAGKKKKINWGLSFSAGRSSVREGFGFSNKSLFADAINYQSGTPASQPSSPSSVIRSSFSWSAGVFVIQPLSEKLNANFGFGYTYISTKNNVGSRVDSSRTINNSNSTGLSVSNFYRSSSGNTVSSYTNKFHFIGLSADLSWLVIQKKNFKLYWENGLSYNFLAGSTMLHYDRSLPGYYQDNSLLRKGQLFFTSGLAIPLRKNIMISPFAAYSLTHVLKNTDSVRTNFSNYGIRFKMFFNKK